ncbi:MAG: alpha/beta hydrolase [Chloroflexi bacterium]|nr:MAG: alpha/beta hydrolase [Chloroflexota bacterium]
MTLRTFVALCAILAMLAISMADNGAREARAADTILELPVSFQVVNTNTSGAACPFDGLPYTVRGHLVGPQSIIYGPGPRAITFYVHGFSSSEPNWSFKLVPGYDLPVEMAKLGHVSLVINRLGYSPSDHPPGFESCLGSAADVVHQIIGQLRSQGAQLPDGTHVVFSKVALAGHDTGATIAEVEAYSYKDIDGLFISAFANTGFTQKITEWSIKAGAACLQGGQPSDQGAPNYHYFPAITDEEFSQDEPLLREIFPYTDETVFQAVKQAIADHKRQLNPCGDINSVPGTVPIDMARLNEVTIPVLIFVTDSDFAFSKEGLERERTFFSGSSDVSSPFLPQTPHFWMWGQTAPMGREIESDWLCARGFVSAGVNCSTPGKVSGGGQIDPGTGEPATDPLTGQVLQPATMIIHSGSANASAGGQANFGFVVQYASGDAAPSGNLTYKDQRAGVDLKATSLQMLAISDGACGTNTHARFTGKATVNGSADQSFAVEIDDCAQPGSTDKFKIMVSGPNQTYEAEGVLIAGNISIRR